MKDMARLVLIMRVSKHNMEKSIVSFCESNWCLSLCLFQSQDYVSVIPCYGVSSHDAIKICQ